MKSIHPDACAFPTGESGDPGLTVRAYVATQVLSGLAQKGDSQYEQEAARRAVRLADALIAELNREAK